jgi:hypothetical protein
MFRLWKFKASEPKIEIMKAKAQTILIIAVLALCSSCTMFMAKWPPSADPLKGWNSWTSWDEESHPAEFSQPVQPAKHAPLAKTIKDDYQNYLNQHQSIPIDIHLFYEDGTGQHAVKVQTETFDRDFITYIFIYDKFDKRTKVMKFYGGHTSC